jgi:ectoine hydroxylase
MQLTREQIESFEEQGYLFFPNCFAEEEVALCAARRTRFPDQPQEVWREKTGAPRTAFAAHTYNEAFRLMAHHRAWSSRCSSCSARRLRPSIQDQRQGGVRGRVWQWHQDYGTWARDDGMPQPRAMNISIFLDEVLPINGPLMSDSESHKYGTLAAGTTRARPPIRFGRSIPRR